MKTEMLEGLVERAANWPAEAQAELLRSALDIELRCLGGYPLSDDDRAALARSAEDVIADEHRSGVRSLGYSGVARGRIIG